MVGTTSQSKHSSLVSSCSMSATTIMSVPNDSMMTLYPIVYDIDDTNYALNISPLYGTTETTPPTKSTTRKTKHNTIHSNSKMNQTMHLATNDHNNILSTKTFHKIALPSVSQNSTTPKAPTNIKGLVSSSSILDSSLAQITPKPKRPSIGLKDLHRNDDNPNSIINSDGSKVNNNCKKVRSYDDFVIYPRVLPTFQDLYVITRQVRADISIIIFMYKYQIFDFFSV